MGSNDSSSSIGGSIKNMSIVANLAKSKKSDLTKSKKSNLPNTNFAKDNTFGTDFLNLEVKETFIYLQKTFTETPIFYHFDSEYHIGNESDTLRYAIDRVLS